MVGAGYQGLWSVGKSSILTIVVAFGVQSSNSFFTFLSAEHIPIPALADELARQSQ